MWRQGVSPPHPSPAPHLWWSWAPHHPSFCRGDHFSLSRLSSSPGSQPLPAQLTSAFRGNQNPQEKMGQAALPTTQAKTSLRGCPASAHASRWREAAPGPTEGTSRPTVCLRAACVSHLALSRGPGSHPSGPFLSHVCAPWNHPEPHAPHLPTLYRRFPSWGLSSGTPQAPCTHPQPPTPPPFLPGTRGCQAWP